MRVAVRVDAGPLVGGGHAMRCLTLSDALADQGAQVTFVTAAMPEPLEARIAAAGHAVRRIDPVPGVDRSGPNWHEPPLDAAAQVLDAQACRDTCGSVEWTIVDHYLLDRNWHSKAREFADQLLVIDDLANRPHDCDVLVDETGGRTPRDYDGLLPEGAVVLAGAPYALLRPEFARERPAALKRRSLRNTAERLLVSLGTTDPGAIAATIVDAALAAAPRCAVDVVVAHGAQSLPRLHEIAGARPGIAIHVDSDRMAELMRNADLAIGAAGTTSWERCCVGLPAIALVLAENQRPNADALERAGAAIRIEGVDEIGPALARIVDNLEQLQRMSDAAFQLTDGLGACRVTEAMLGTRAKASAIRA